MGEIWSLCCCHYTLTVRWFQHCPSTYDLRARAAPSMVAAAGGCGKEATGGTLADLENWYNSNGGLRRHTPRLRLWPRNEAAVFCCANSVSKALAKEIVERRHGEPIKFLFLPKMGLLGSQACTEKKIGCEF